MSRRSFSKSTNHTRLGGNNSSSLGDAIAAKNPELAKEMQKRANDKKTERPMIAPKESYYNKKTKKPVEIKVSDLLIKEIQNLDYLDDGIPPNPIQINDKHTNQMITEAAKGFENYLDKDNKRDTVILVIGCDFGTSSTKVVVQQAFADGRSVAIPVPIQFRPDSVEKKSNWHDFLSFNKSRKQANGHPHCWKTLLYYDEQTQTFSLRNGQGKKEIRNIKTNVMSKKNPVLIKSGEIQLTPDHLASAYLGLLLRYVKGWVYNNFSKYFGLDISKYNIQWQINLGVPATSLDDPKVERQFSDILNTAWNISENKAKLSPRSINEYFIHSVQNYEKNKEFANLRPEVTAEAACLIASDVLDYKTYALVDIGASTLDVCVFNYFNTGESHKQAMLVAEVKLLGSQSKSWLQQITQPDGQLFTDDHLKQAIRSIIARSIILAKTKKDLRSPVWTGTLEILMAGGGAFSDLHRAAITDFKKDFIKHTQTQNVVLNHPTVPPMLKHECDENTAHRLAVAWGLSINGFEFLEYDPPSSADDMIKKTSSLENNFISKDQV